MIVMVTRADSDVRYHSCSGVVDRCMIVDTNEIDQAAKDSDRHNFDS